jgi:hypothetical protein
MSRARGQWDGSMRRRALALETLELRAVLAADPLYTILDVGERWSSHWEGVAHKPDGEIRLLEYLQGSTAWDFDHAGQKVDRQSLTLPQYADQPLARQIVSRDGSWMVAQYYDFDTTPGHEWNPVVALWNGIDPASAVRIDVRSLTRRFVGVKDISNSGDVVLTGVQTSYRWNPATGLVALAPLTVEQAGNEPPFAIANAISAGGSVVVGYTANYPDSIPTYWDATGPHALATNGARGAASTISDDGRVIGGVLEKNYVHYPVVWVDGRLTELRDENGGSMKGTIQTVVNGLGGDPTRWAALGQGNLGQPWIAFSDGIARPLGSWLLKHYGIQLGNPPNDPAAGTFLALSNNTGLYSVLDAFAHNDALEIVITDMVVVGTTASIPGSPIYGQSTPRLIIAPLAAEAPQEAVGPMDINNDGSVSPLDALIIINVLNSDGPGLLAHHPQIVAAFPRIDTNRDGYISAADALVIINFLNDRANSLEQIDSGNTVDSPEGEGEASAGDDGGMALLLATDEVFTNPRRRGVRRSE